MPLSEFIPNPESPHLKEDKKILFLQEFPKHGTISKTAQAINIHRSSINRWRNEDPKFKEAFDDIENGLTDTLEESAMERALSGSETLTIFLLKSRRPQIYRENSQYNLNKKMVGFRDNLLSTIIGVIKQNLTDTCPSCHNGLDYRKRIVGQLQELAQKSPGSEW